MQNFYNCFKYLHNTWYIYTYILIYGYECLGNPDKRVLIWLLGPILKEELIKMFQL